MFYMAKERTVIGFIKTMTFIRDEIVGQVAKVLGISIALRTNLTGYFYKNAPV